MSALDEIVYNSVRLHDRSSVVSLQRIHLTGWVSAASSAHLRLILWRTRYKLDNDDHSHLIRK